MGMTCRILLYGHQTGNTASLLKLAPDHMSRALRRDHPDVNTSRRRDLIEPDGEAVSEHEQVACFDAVCDFGFPDLGLPLVREQDHHDVSAARCLSDSQDFESCGLSLFTAGGIRTQANDHIDS